MFLQIATQLTTIGFCSLRPVATSQLRNRQQRLADVLLAVAKDCSAVGSVWPSAAQN